MATVENAVSNRVERGPCPSAQYERPHSRGEQQVEIPQRLGGLGDSRCELRVLHGPRRLGAVELHPADAEHRQDGDRQHDDPHAAEPLQQVTVEEHRLGEIVEPGDDRRPGGGEARDGLEHRIGERQVRVYSLSSSGTLPVRPSASQNATTMTKPSRSLRSPRERRTGNQSAAPAPATSSIETMNGGADGSW